MLMHTMTQEQLDEALESVERLERVEIELVAGDGFAYRLFGDGRLVIAGTYDRRQLAEMLVVTEVLLNPELGIRGRRVSLVGRLIPAGCN